MKIVTNSALSQTFAKKLEENPAYLRERYPTIHEQEMCNQRLSLKQTLDAQPTIAVMKTYDANGQKFAPDDTRVDLWEAYERGYDHPDRHGYQSKTEMTLPNGPMDDRLMYPASERALFEYEAQRTGVMAPVRITIPAEFSAFVGKPFEDLNVKENTADRGLKVLNDFSEAVFAGHDWMADPFPAGDRMLIDGISAREFTEGKFPDATKDELKTLIPSVITTALVSGEHKLSMLYIFKGENSLYEPYVVPLEPDLIGVCPNPETRKQAEQRQAEANQRPFTHQEEQRHQKMLGEMRARLFDKSAERLKREMHDQIVDDIAPERHKINQEFEVKQNAITAPLRAALTADFDRIKVPHYSQTGVAPAKEIALPRGSIPAALGAKGLDTLTLAECMAAAPGCKLTDQFTELFGVKVPPGGTRNIYDTMLIDGKSVSTMVRERFPNQTDQNEVAALREVTLATAIASGNHQVSTFRLVEEKGLHQVQEQPIKMDVSALYPSRREALGWFRSTFLDWGPFKAPPTRGELAQQGQTALMTRPLTKVQQADKDATLQTLHAAIRDETAKNTLAKCGSEEIKPLFKQRFAQLAQHDKKIDLVVEARITKWKRSIEAPGAPEKNNPQTEEKTHKIEKSKQAEKSAGKQMPM